MSDITLEVAGEEVTLLVEEESPIIVEVVEETALIIELQTGAKGEPGDLDIPGFSVDPTTGGIQMNNETNPNDLSGGFQLTNFRQYITPLQNSDNESWYTFNISAYLDFLNSGFSQGRSSNVSVGLMNNYVEHHGSGDVGGINLFSHSFDLGNGTDPIAIKGLAYMLGQGQFRANTTVDGPIQGYGFQFGMHASTVFSSYAIAFYDFAQCPGEAGGWTGLALGSTIGSIANNSNYQGVAINPTISTFTGNAGFTGVGVSPNLGTLGTNGFQGVSISPNITTAGANSAVGLNIYMGNVSGSNVKAMQVVGDCSIQGDVSISGDLQFSGDLSIGKLFAGSNITISDGGGNPASNHMLISNVNGTANSTVNNCDLIGVNTAALIGIPTNSINNAGAFGLGIVALALPCVATMEGGAYVSHMSGAAYALQLSGAATGGTIDRLSLCHAVAIPNGITTINNLIGYYYRDPFGPSSANIWGFYAEADCENFFKGSLKIGGVVGTTDRVTNSSVALEIESTTKAMRVSQMNNAEEGALTALDGMIIYNSETGKFRGRAAGAWVDLH